MEARLFVKIILTLALIQLIRLKVESYYQKIKKCKIRIYF